MKSFFKTGRGIVTLAVILIIGGAIMAALVPFLNIPGAILALFGLVILFAWAVVHELQ